MFEFSSPKYSQNSISIEKFNPGINISRELFNKIKAFFTFQKGHRHIPPLPALVDICLSFYLFLNHDQ